MSGWSPGDDLSELLDDLTSSGPGAGDGNEQAGAGDAPESAAVGEAADGGPIAVPAGLRRRGGGTGHGGSSQGLTLVAEELAGAEPAVVGAVTVESGSAQRAPTRPDALRRGREAGRPGGETVATTVRLPVGVVEAMTLRRLSAAAEGGRFVINTFVNDAAAALPTNAGALAKELDRYRDRLNLGLTRRDPGYTPTRLVALRLSAAVDAALDRAVLELYRRDGTKVDRQSLIAVAILRSMGPGDG
jgi:hypothetical protein